MRGETRRFEFFGVDLKQGRETLSLAFPSSGMRQVLVDFRDFWRVEGSFPLTPLRIFSAMGVELFQNLGVNDERGVATMPPPTLRESAPCCRTVCGDQSH